MFFMLIAVDLYSDISIIESAELMFWVSLETASSADSMCLLTHRKSSALQI